MDESIVIPKFRLTPDELSMLKPKRAIARLIVLTILMTAIIVCLMQLLRLPTAYAIGGAVIGAPLIFLSMYMERGRQFQKPAYGIFLLDRDLALTSSGITQMLSNGMTSYAPWSAISHVEDVGAFILVHFAPLQFFVIPRKVMSAELQQQVLTFFHSKGLLKPSK